MKRELSNWMENLEFHQVQLPARFVARKIKVINSQKRAVLFIYRENIPFQLRYLREASSGKDTNFDESIFSNVDDVAEYVAECNQITIDFEFSKFKTLAVWEPQGECVLDRLEENLSYKNLVVVRRVR